VEWFHFLIDLSQLAENSLFFWSAGRKKTAPLHFLSIWAMCGVRMNLHPNKGARSLNEF
jgi:hypothetical protein